MYDLIKKYEGCRLDSYLCDAGVATIGWGNTIYEDGVKVKLGDKITQERAESLLQWHIKEEIYNRVKIPAWLSKEQEEAVVSLIYNIGYVAYNKSSLKKDIDNEDIKGIFTNWNWISGGGKPLRGLCKRRAEELLLFFSDNIGESK